MNDIPVTSPRGSKYPTFGTSGLILGTWTLWVPCDLNCKRFHNLSRGLGGLTPKDGREFGPQVGPRDMMPTRAQSGLIESQWPMIMGYFGSFMGYFTE